MPQYKVTTALRLRSSAGVEPNNIKTVLPPDTIVTDAGPSGVTGWLHVTANVHNTPLDGYVSWAYVVEVDAAAAADAVSNSITPVNLSTSQSITRNQVNGRAFPLNEQNMPERGPAALPEARVAQLWQIMDFLDVEHSARYQPTSSQTFCNIYAYDYCCRANAYLPRVWWSGKALTQLSQPNAPSVPIKYGDTVNELTANSLYDWFHDFGDDFGWQRMLDMDAFQEGVNQGQVGIIVAKRAIVSRSGHIVAVIPESGAHQAERSGGRVTGLLQSQAGAKNKKAFTSTWYLSANFSGFSWWLHP